LADGITGSLRLVLSVTKPKSGGASTRFGGALVLSAPKPVSRRTTMEFDVSFDKDANAKTLVAFWSTKDKVGLLDAVGPFLGPEITLPPEVVEALVVTAVRFHYTAPAQADSPATVVVVAGDDKKWKASLALF
jgi:hypothetical protein